MSVPATTAYSTGPITLSVWRLIHPTWQDAPLSGEGARRFGGRWNMKGWPALYLSTDTTTAVAEYYRDLARPGMLVPHRVEAQAIADLTDGRGSFADARVREAVMNEWDKIAKRDGAVPPSWTLAHELIAAGAEGALVPSLQSAGGVNLVLWRWHDAATSGEGAALTLLDPEQALTGRKRG